MMTMECNVSSKVNVPISVVSGSGLIAALIILLAFSQPANAVVGLASAAQGLDYAASLLNEYEANAAMEQDEARRREMLRITIARARNKVLPIAEETRKSLRQLENQLQKMRQERNNAPQSEWSSRDREEYNRLKSTADELEQLVERVNATAEDLKFLNSRMTSEGDTWATVKGFVPEKNTRFQQAFKRVKVALPVLSENFQSFRDTYSIESGSGAQGTITVVGASHAKIVNDSEKMVFRVSASDNRGAQWSELRPGKSKEISLRLGEGGRIFIQAMSWDATRQRIVAAHDNLSSGKMSNVRLREHKADYLIHYGNNRLATFVRSEKEHYTWNWGNNMSRAIGKKSPWSATGSTVPEPMVTSSRPEKSGDLPSVHDDIVEWYVPRVDEGSVVFAFQVQSNVEWFTQRQLASGSKRENSETEVENGTLKVIVSR